MDQGTSVGRSATRWANCSLVVILGALPLAYASSQVLGSQDKADSAVLESVPASNDMWHNDLGDSTYLRITGATTSMFGDNVHLFDYGAGLHVREFQFFIGPGADIIGHCSDTLFACTAEATCAGQTHLCAAHHNPCTTDADCADSDGISYDYCAVCQFDDHWVKRVVLYDTFNTGSSPVNGGLISKRYYNSGGVWGSADTFGPNLLYAVGEVDLLDPDIFYTIEQKKIPWPFDANMLRNPTDAQFDAAAYLPGVYGMRGTAPPEVGSSENGGYFDRDANLILDAVDFVPGYGAGGVNRINQRSFFKGNRNPALVDAGAEFYSIAGNGDSYVDLNVGAGTFDFSDGGDDCTGGFGSSTDLVQHVVLEGTTAAQNIGIPVPAFNAIFEHNTFLLPGGTTYNLTVFGAHPLGGAAIVVSYDDGGGNITNVDWDLSVCNNSSANGGTETASRNACVPTPATAGQGGAISMTLSLRPKLIFVKRSDPACVVTVDSGIPVPMTGPAFKWNDTPADPQIGIGSGFSFDKTCDGNVDTPPTVGGNDGPFNPGTFIPRCPGDLSCDDSPPVTRLFRLTGNGWGLAFHQAVATVAFTDRTDTDGDGVLDGADDCDFVFDPQQVDSDGDGRGDRCQVCPCGVPDTDTDLDGTLDCMDGCPNDPHKIAPGLCGCGAADIDDDGDGVCADLDQCPGDPHKIAPGVCGCGVADIDGDGDGRLNCLDGCPADPSKIVPGACGCGVPDTDSDGDGVADCVDNCPTVANPDQTDCDHNGIGAACDGDGCGGPWTDTDNDGIPDTVDPCPRSILDPTVVIPPAGVATPPPGTAPNTFLPCDTGVPNFLFPLDWPEGCTLSDEIAACDASSHNHGQFQKCVKALLNQWKRDHLITEPQRKAIDKCVKRYKKRDLHAGSPGAAEAGAIDH